MPRRIKEKLFMCPKCNKPYRCLGWMKRHLNTSGHSSTWIIYYNSDTIHFLTNRIVQLESKLNNLDFKNIIMKSSDFAIEKIKKEEVPKEKEANMVNLTVVIQQLNVVFKTITPGDHNVRPSDILKNLKN